MKTLVMIAHPDLEDSQSHQFLLQSGQTLTNCDYLDLTKVYQTNGKFDCQYELNRLRGYDRIVFQFQLFWYQAPSILKEWFDQVFEYQDNYAASQQLLTNKELGIVVIAGAKESHYHRLGKFGVTMDDLLSPYVAFANYMHMRMLPYFSINQFHFQSEEDKFQLLLAYITYLEKGQTHSLSALQETLMDKLEKITEADVKFDTKDWVIFEQLIQTMRFQAEEIEELYRISQGEQ